MTVAELIADLSKYDPTWPVLIGYDGGYLSNLEDILPLDPPEPGFPHPALVLWNDS